MLIKEVKPTFLKIKCSKCGKSIIHQKMYNYRNEAVNYYFCNSCLNDVRDIFNLIETLNSKDNNVVEHKKEKENIIDLDYKVQEKYGIKLPYLDLINFSIEQIETLDKPDAYIKVRHNIGYIFKCNFNINNFDGSTPFINYIFMQSNDSNISSELINDNIKNSLALNEKTYKSLVNDYIGFKLIEYDHYNNGYINYNILKDLSLINYIIDDRLFIKPIMLEGVSKKDLKLKKLVLIENALNIVTIDNNTNKIIETGKIIIKIKNKLQSFKIIDLKTHLYVTELNSIMVKIMKSLLSPENEMTLTVEFLNKSIKEFSFIEFFHKYSIKILQIDKNCIS